MAKKQAERELMVGLDIGSSKIAAVVGQFNEQGTLTILGYGSAPSQGLSRGTVVNIDATVQAIRKAVENAEIMAGCQINNAYTGMADRHIRCVNSEGMVPIRDHEVTVADVARVIDAAKTVALPLDHQILHILPQEFKVDNEAHIREPLGMSGVRLEAKVHMITGAMTAAQNVAKCVKRCGLEVNDIILDPLAASCTLLSPDEKELGVCLVDIGAGTSNVVIFSQGAIRHTAVLPVAGDQVTNDLAITFRLPSQQAERAKMMYGCAWVQEADPSLSIDVPGIAGRHMQTLSQVQLAEVIEARYEEILRLVKVECQRAGLDHALHAGVVLSGGASMVPGLVTLAESVFDCPVRIGLPQNVLGMSDVVANPMYATSVGLLVYAEQQQRAARLTRTVRRDGVKGVWGRIKSWVSGNF